MRMKYHVPKNESKIITRPFIWYATQIVYDFVELIIF
jgi:hypothetical protein